MKRPAVRPKLFSTLVISVFLACNTTPPRPANVPSQAVFVEGAKNGWWANCTFIASSNINQCSVYGVSGNVILEGEFKPFDGGSPVSPDQLMIDNKNSLSSIHRICLKNGRVLIPVSLFDQEHDFLEKILSSRK
jgi:hypothetical protein